MSTPSEVAKEVLEVVKQNLPEYYGKLDSDKTREVTRIATDIATNEFRQAENFKSILDSPPKILSDKLAAYLPSDRIHLIQKGLQIPSYRLNFRHEKGYYFADITKSARPHEVNGLSSYKLDTAESITAISGIQIASIVVEAIALVLSIVGIIAFPKRKLQKLQLK